MKFPLKKDIKMLYQGTDVTKIEKPRKINWWRVLDVATAIFVLVIAMICILYIGLYYQLKEDYDWAKENSFAFYVMNK